MELRDILKLTADEIFDYIIKNPNEENEIINKLKVKDREKFFKLSSDLRSYKLNQRGAAALKKDLLTSIPKDKSVLNLKVDNIKANPGQPRKFFNDDKLNELSESIKEHGLLQPIVVTDNNDDTYTLVAGERRLRAHKLANISEIKAIVIDADEIRSRELALIENLHRDNLTPIEEGLSYLALQNVTGYSLRKLEDVVKKGKNYVDRRLKLTNFNDDCIDFIIKQELVNVSKLLKILDTESTVHKMLLEKLAKKELSNEEIENFSTSKITKLPDEKSPTKAIKTVDVDHDKFDENPDFSKDKKIANIEALKEKIKSEDNAKSSNDESIETATVVKQSDSFLIKSLGDVVNITIDRTKLTGKDLELILDTIKSL